MGVEKIFDKNGSAHTQNYDAKKNFVLNLVGGSFLKGGFAKDDYEFYSTKKRKFEVEVFEEEASKFSFYYESSASVDLYGYESFRGDLARLYNPIDYIEDFPFDKVKRRILFTAYEEQKENAGYRIRIEGEHSTVEFYGNIYNYHITNFSNMFSNKYFDPSEIDYDYLVLGIYGYNRPKPSSGDVKPDLLIIRRERSKEEKESLPNTEFYFDDLKISLPSSTSLKLGYEEASSFSGSIFTENQIKEKGDTKMRDRLSSLMPERVSKGIALSINGSMAVKTRNGSYVSFNKETGQIEDHMDFVFGEDKMADFCFLMPVDRSTIKTGDVVATNSGYGFVTSVDVSTGDIVCVDATDATKAEIIPVKNVLTNTAMVKKLITLFGDVAQGGGINPMMFLLMDKEGGKDTDNMFKLMMMTQMMGGGNVNTEAFGGINPMMFMFL